MLAPDYSFWIWNWTIEPERKFYVCGENVELTLRVVDPSPIIIINSVVHRYIDLNSVKIGTDCRIAISHSGPSS